MSTSFSHQRQYDPHSNFNFSRETTSEIIRDMGHGVEYKTLRGCGTERFISRSSRNNSSAESHDLSLGLGHRHICNASEELSFKKLESKDKIILTLGFGSVAKFGGLASTMLIERFLTSSSSHPWILILILVLF